MTTKPKRKPRIGITSGDINGIGTELLINAFQDPKLPEMFTPVLYSSSRVLNIYRKMLGTEKFSYNVVQHPDQAQPKRISVIECHPGVEQVDPGKPSPEAGRAAWQSLKRAVEDLRDGHIDALVTMPIDKKSIQGSDFDFPGHTEYLAKTFGAESSLMLMVSEHVRIGTVTGHIPLRNVSDALNIQLIYQKIRMMHDTLKTDFTLQKPRIAVLGVNPHAGDNGFLGKEDAEKIAKAVQKAENDNIFVKGPYSADGFFGSGTFRKFDGILAMYHDQGLIPFKLMAGFEGVNFTAGLPVVRTSPDHGVAYDLVGRNIATPDSFIHALYVAMDVLRNRTENQELAHGALRSGVNLKRYNLEEDVEALLDDSE